MKPDFFIARAIRVKLEKYFSYTITFRQKDTLLFWAINPILRITDFKFPLLRTPIRCSWGRPHIKNCTCLQRSWSRKTAVDVNTFHRPHLKNWECYYYYYYYYYYCCCCCCCRWWYLLLGLLVLRPSILSLLQSATILLQSTIGITKCDRTYDSPGTKLLRPCYEFLRPRSIGYLRFLLYRMFTLLLICLFFIFDLYFRFSFFSFSCSAVWARLFNPV